VICFEGITGSINNLAHGWRNPDERPGLNRCPRLPGSLPRAALAPGPGASSNAASETSNIK